MFSLDLPRHALAGRLVDINRGERQQADQQEVADDDQDRAVHDGRGEPGRDGRRQGLRGRGFRFEQQLPAQRAQVEDLEHRHEDDAERRGRVSGHEARLDHPQRHQDQRDDGAREAQVEPGVEEVVFVLQQLQLDARRQVLPADFRQLDQAGRIEQRLAAQRTAAGSIDLVGS